MDLSNAERNPNAPLRLLSLDGGGVRGLSSLLVLDTLMENIALEEKRLGRRATNDYEPLKPCDYFDLIGGTSTGGIIAIMLSRLRLDCKQCIAVYCKLAEQIFKHDRSINAFGMKIPTGATRFSGAVLANAIKSALTDLGFDADELMWDEELFEEIEDDLPGDSIWADAAPKLTLTESPLATMKNSLASLESGTPGDTKPGSTLYSSSPFNPKQPTRKSTWKAHKRTSVHQKADKKGCRGLVLTSLKNALGLPRVLSTYDPNDRTTRIWEALRATSAAPTFFEEMQFGTPKVTYLDGGVGFNNPCAEVDYAAKALWEDRSIGVILSVGTGLQSIPSVKKIASWLPFGLGTDLSIASALTGMATSTARVDNEMRRMYTNSDTKYFRFDVDRGLADVSLEQWMKEDEMASLTELYMTDSLQIRKARAFAELMANLSALPPKFEIGATEFAVDTSGSRQLGDSFKLVHVDFKSGLPMGVGLTTPQHFRTRSSPTGEGGLAMDETGRLRKIYPVAADLDHDGRREEAAVYQCVSAENICLRSIKTGIPQGKYRVSFIVAFHDSAFSPPRDVVFSVGKPFDYQTFTTRYVDVKITPDVASVLLHPDAVRVRVGSRRYEEFKGKGWVEIQGDTEVSVGLDGALGFLVSKRYEKETAVDGWSFGGVRLEPMFGSSGAIQRQVELGRVKIPDKTPGDLTQAPELTLPSALIPRQVDFGKFEKPEKTPAHLTEALQRRDSRTVRMLLEIEFEKVARDDYEWLNELADVGYSWYDISQLLLEEENDAPWIYCDPQDLPAQNAQRLALISKDTAADWILRHREMIAKDPVRNAFSNSPWLSKRHDIKKIVQQLCGLGGVAPTSRSLQDWNGEVIFEDNFSTSYISYSIASQDDEATRLSQLASRLKRILRSFCEAATALQGAGLCLEYLTIARTSATPNASIREVEIMRVDIDLAAQLYKELDKLPSCISSDMLSRGTLLLEAFAVLAPFLKDTLWSFDRCMIEDPLHFCCLAAQCLCIGLVSFCQGHIGPIESVFTNHPQERSVLLGRDTLNGDGMLPRPHIAVRLTKLTCLSEMTKGPLITFSLLRDPPSESERSQAVIQEAFSDPNKISQLGLKDLFADQDVHNVAATPEDILYTWGPGQLVSCGDKEDEIAWLQSINVGGGVIYYEYEFGRRLHWEAGPGPKKSPERSFHYRNRVIVGAPVTKNLTQCSFDWKTWRLSCPLVHLAVRPEGWAMNQRQLGLQVGPDHVALQAIQVWSKIPAKLLKEYQLEQGDFGLMEFLGYYVGVQVSCCTGVARRISLQELLSDLIPTFCITHMGETDWNDWNTQDGIVSGLCRDGVSEWLRTLRHSSAASYVTLLKYFHRILSILEPTGLNRERTHIKIAWPKEGDLHRGVKVSCQDKHLWAQVLADSEEGVTFAYMTTTCLICKDNPCQAALQQSWRMAPKCLGTAVIQYRNEVDEDDDPTTGPWTLQNGQSYHMWNEKRCIRMKADSSPPSAKQYRLMASESAIPSHFVTRHFRSKRAKKNLLRERHHPEDAAVDVLIVDKE
ncbi:hypothetical protein yc1106_02424 [Curvularia clavata]|uniref:PNPLA domain-containing protein n=1 Tax=Curvularia clavata TaxID=95742 RepID=A0A9Q8Z3S2_CURCL|nr:hypothetical protein yc1106_02424 [Curvularia clavata]